MLIGVDSTTRVNLRSSFDGDKACSQSLDQCDRLRLGFQQISTDNKISTAPMCDHSDFQTIELRSGLRNCAKNFLDIAETRQGHLPIGWMNCTHWATCSDLYFSSWPSTIEE